MYRIMKQGISLLVAMAFMVSLMTVGGAEKTENSAEAKQVLSTAKEEALFRLEALNIVEPAFGERAGQMVSRAEFAKILLHLISYESVGDVAGRAFADVGDDNMYHQYIETANRLGLLKGFSDGLYRPNDPITGEQAVKVLVEALGYQPMAEQSGGYPTGHILTAAKLNITKIFKADYKQPLTVGNLILLLDSSLDVDLMIEVFSSRYSGMQFKVEDDNTLFLLRLHVLDLVYGRGIVNANAQTSLTGDAARKGGVVIGGRAYFAGATNAERMLGYAVEYFATEQESAEPDTLTAVRKQTKCEAKKIRAEDIVEVKNGDITYYTQEENEDRLPLSDGYQVVYNKKVTQLHDPDMLMPESGVLELIDNNGDGEYEVVLVSAWSVFEVKSADENRGMIYLKEGRLNGKGYLELKSNRQGSYWNIYNQDGEQQKISDIQPGEMIEVCASYDNEAVDIYLIRNTIEGTVEQIDIDRKVTIGGLEYTLWDNAELLEEIKPGTSGIFTVGSERQIVKFVQGETADGTEKYAFVQGIDMKPGISGDIQLRLVDGGSFKTVEEDTDEDNMIDTMYMEICNTGTNVFSCADTILFNRVRIDKEELSKRLNLNPSSPKENPVIKYVLNKDGEISKIDVAQPNGVQGTRTLNIPARLFGGAIGGAFLVNADTKIMNIPAGASEDFEEGQYLTSCRLQNKTGYEVVGLDVDSETKIAKAAVIVTTSDTTTGKINNRTKVSVVSRSTRALGNDGSEVVKLSGYTADQPFTKTTNADIQDVADTLMPGDLIYFSVDYKDEINEIRVLKRFLDLDTYYSRLGEISEVYGLVDFVRSNYVADTSTDLQDYISVNVANAGEADNLKTVAFSAITKPPVYIYDVKRERISPATSDEILSVDNAGYDNAEEVYTYASNSVVKVVLIIDR